MLSADVLNSDALVNNFEVINTLDFIPGADFTLVIRLKQPQQKDLLRYVAATGAALTLHLPKKDGTNLDVVMTAYADDRSMWQGTIAAADSEDLVSGNATLTLVEGVKITLGWIENALALVVTGDC